MKKISIYIQGGIQSAVFRYRFYQYFQNMQGYIRYNKRLSDKIYSKLMPVGEKGMLIKFLVYFYMLYRVCFQMLTDLFNGVDILIISRVLVKKRMPFFFYYLLKQFKKNGTKIIWDFDDDILAMKEISAKDFMFFSELADTIILASPFLIDLFKEQYKSKVIVIPTTEGVMQNLFTTTTNDKRIIEYSQIVKLLWVGTSSGLKFVSKICPQLEKAAIELKKFNKKLVLTLVCNRNIDYNPLYFQIVFKEWTFEIAQSSFLNSHIGLMPLENSKVAKGKGGFKLIQYLSVGLPSLASPIGINKLILQAGGGYLIENEENDDWSDSIVKIGTDINLWRELSENARINYNINYSFHDNLEKWQSVIN